MFEASKRVSRALTLLAALAAIAIAWAPRPAIAQEDQWELCISRYWASREGGDAVLGIAPSDAELMIREIAASFSLSATSITILECHMVAKAVTVYSDGVRYPNVRAGEYMIYNPRWVQEVIGDDRVQAIALFGHELGHLFNRDFLPPRNTMDRAQKETEADHFAGCAVASLRGDWASVQNLFSRLRNERDSYYPNRLASLETAQAGFNQCSHQPITNGGTVPPDVARVIDRARAAAEEAEENTYRARDAEEQARRYQRQALNGEGGFQHYNYGDGASYAGQPRPPGSHAMGVYRNNSGDEYAGVFGADATSQWFGGLGVYTYGDVHVAGVQAHMGEFVGNQLTGLGAVYYSTLTAVHFERARNAGETVWAAGSGARYLGRLSDDHPHGLGVMTLSNGRQLIGEWRGGVLSGLGAELSAAGDVVRAGDWINGVYQAPQ